MTTCEHTTCNSSTDYECVPCEGVATHRVVWPDGGRSSLACESHLNEYRNILTEMDLQGLVKVWPDFVRLEL